MSDLSCQAVDNTSVHPLRFEPQALRGYTLVLPTSFQLYLDIHNPQLPSGSEAAGGAAALTVF